MKSILMLLLLVATQANSALAKSNANPSECLQMYGTYMKEYGASKFIPSNQMLSFIYQCLPANYLNNSTLENDQQNQGVLHINEENGKIITIRT